MSDYIPSTDGALTAWMNAFTTYANANVAALGVVAADVTALVTQMNSFNVACVNADNARHQALSATQLKLAARRTAETSFRNMVRKLQANLNLTDAQRQGLGITLRDSQPGGVVALAQSVDRPLVLVDNARQLIHRVRFVQEGQPTRRARPEGTNGCELRMLVLEKDAPAPADPEAMRAMGMPTSSPEQITFTAAEGGKVAWYRVRWINSTNRPVGEWSRPVGAMILA